MGHGATASAPRSRSTSSPAATPTCPALRAGTVLIEERDAINARRLAQWQSAVPVPGKAQHLMLLIGEVKEIVPARYGFKAIVKHLPDQAFAIDEQLYRRLGRRFESELALWGASDDIHMVMIATFGVSSAGVPAIHELCLMPVTRQWLPVEMGSRSSSWTTRRREPRVREGLQVQPCGDLIGLQALRSLIAGLNAVLFHLFQRPHREPRWALRTTTSQLQPGWRSSVEPMPPFRRTERGRCARDIGHSRLGRRRRTRAAAGGLPQVALRAGPVTDPQIGTRWLRQRVAQQYAAAWFSRVNAAVCRDCHP